MIPVTQNIENPLEVHDKGNEFEAKVFAPVSASSEETGNAGWEKALTSKPPGLLTTNTT